ncbi:MAG: FliG C-terminal domain-containing protein [Rubripirellula sp.]
MANGWDSGLEREAMLRRVAIVLSSLPAPVAANLLGEIDADTKVAVRRTMMSLSDVDPLEQKRALHAFKVSVQKPEASPDQFQASSDREAIPKQVTQSQSQGNASSRVVRSNSGNAQANIRGDMPADSIASQHPLAFLEQVDEKVLANLLKTERPQIVATVLASINPEHAARILALHGSGLEDMLGRIGKIETIPSASLAELADHFRNSLGKQGEGQSDTVGRRALDAILAAMPRDQEQQVEQQRAEYQSAEYQRAVADQAHSSTDETNAAYTRQQSGFPSAVTAEENLSSKLRIAEGTLPPQSDRPSRSRGPATAQNTNASLVSRQAATDAAIAAPTESATAVNEPRRFSSTDSIHEHLLQLSPQHLCETLGKVQARSAMLALCGLPNQVTSAVLALLPKAESRKVREAMNSLGSLQLREIDQAKEAIAYASLDVVDVPIPSAA